jgi:ABC-type glycerol-3-phosphate transport system substrate-binding protein
LGEYSLIVLYLCTGNIKYVHLNPLPENATSATAPTKTAVAPGSTSVFDRSTQRLRNCSSTLCPYAKVGESEKLINRAPFYGTGGWAFAIRKSASQQAKQDMFNFISYVNVPRQSTPNVASASTVFDSFRNSHLAADAAFKKIGWSDASLSSMRAITRDALEHKNGALDWSFPGAFDLSTTFRDNLFNYITGQITIKTVRFNVEDTWDKVKF